MKNKRNRLFLAVISTALMIFLVLNISLASGVVQSSPEEWFNVTPTELRINWTTTTDGWYSGNVTVIGNSSLNASITLKLSNDTTRLTRNYSQSYPPIPEPCQYGVYLIVQRSDGTGNNTYESINGTNSTNNRTTFTLINRDMQCYPGRYFTNTFSITNTSDETANISIILDIPISVYNTLDNTTGIASFDGIIPVNGTSAYHSFFFNATNSTNTSEVRNATGVMINLSSSSDMDIFLFDSSGNLMAKSINKTHNNESLLYNYLPNSSGEMWEIRVFGNSTSQISYSGNLVFTTLAVEVDGLAVKTIPLGGVNVSENVTSTAVIINKGNLTLNNVREYIDVYAVKGFRGSIGNNFSVLIPNSSITSKVKVMLNWTGSANYSFNLYNQDGVLVANSTNKHTYANISGAMQEEYTETTNIGSTTKYWTIEVLNSTSQTDPYNVTAYIYVPSSDWINTNFTTITLNGTNQEDINVTLTVPTSAMSGSYEAYVRYLDDRGAGISVKLTTEVSTPMLLINNTMSSATYTMIENYGTNLTRQFHFNISNPGGYDLTLNITNSSNQLTCAEGSPVSCAGWEGNFTYNLSSPLVVPAGEWRLFHVNMTFNESMPANTLYSGWIRFNSTNNSTENSIENTSHPYEEFMLNIRLNLTDEIDVWLDFMSEEHLNKTANGTKLENITIRARLYYKNGSQVDEGEGFDVLHNISNFTAVWLQEGNLTIAASRIPGGVESLNFYNATTDMDTFYCSSGDCPSVVWNGEDGYYINATIPANTPGGRYIVNLNLTYDRSNYSYIGRSVFNGSVLFIDNTGLVMSTNTSISSMVNQTSTLFYVNVSNYGALDASAATIRFNTGSCGYSVSGATGNKSGNGCTIGSYGSGIYTFTLPAFNSSCIVWWTVTAGSSAAAACPASIVGGGETWFDTHAINVSVTVTKDSDTVSPPPSGGSTATTTTTTLPPTANLSFTESPTLVVITQNTTNSTGVQVKNTGDVSQAITFTVVDIDSSWWSVNSTNATIASGKIAGFNVTFTVGNVDIKNYAGKFKATSSDKTVTSDFTLHVLPSKSNETGINDTLAIYRSEILQLGATINVTKAQGVNVTLAEISFNALMSQLEDAENYAAAGDYFNAYQLFDGIETQIANVRADLEAAEQRHAEQTTSNWITIGLVIVIIAVAAVLVYLFWPTKSKYKPGKGYAYREKREKIGKKQLKSTVEKTKDFASVVKSKIKKEKKKEYYELK